MKLAKHALTAFYLFLDIHDLGYHPDIVWIWFSEVKNTLGTSWFHWRRILSFCNEYLLSVGIRPDRKYKYIPTLYDELPEWCKEAIAGLLEQKKCEYRETGTLRSYRCSCTSFCLFLINHEYVVDKEENKKDELRSIKINKADFNKNITISFHRNIDILLLESNLLSDLMYIIDTTECCWIKVCGNDMKISVDLFSRQKGSFT